jgi:hypothetical protein
MTRSPAVSLLLVITMACSYRDGPFRQIAGKPFEQSKVAQIVDGTTSEKQLIEWFGEPVDTRQLDGQTREFVYYSRRRRENTATFLFIKRRSSQVWEQHLTVTLRQSIVTKHEYSSRGAAQGAA